MCIIIFFFILYYFSNYLQAIFHNSLDFSEELEFGVKLFVLLLLMRVALR